MSCKLISNFRKVDLKKFWNQSMFFHLFGLAVVLNVRAPICHHSWCYWHTLLTQTDRGRKWLVSVQQYFLPLKNWFLCFYLTSSSLYGLAFTVLYLVPQITPLDLKTQLETSRPCWDFTILIWETGDKMVFLPRT